ncbi:hypothetical protein [Fibrobacter sp. UWEL]|nr:hypothetical protein [Fibrobacter sp. UWEL]SHL00589.1 hypothetical protein SAMN05720468_11154 [Fibrobacter sp. UWEL]
MKKYEVIDKPLDEEERVLMEAIERGDFKRDYETEERFRKMKLVVKGPRR